MQRMAAALASALGALVLVASSAQASPFATFTFGGTITEIGAFGCPALTPAFDVAAGDGWSLTYTFDLATADVDGSSTAGQYRDPVTDMTITLGSTTYSGAPGAVVPNGLASLIGVNLGSGFADYVAEVGLPQLSADDSFWAHLFLADDAGTPMISDALPTDLPTPLEDAFPSRLFSLRAPGSTLVCVRGTVDTFSAGLSGPVGDALDGADVDPNDVPEDVVDALIAASDDGALILLEPNETSDASLVLADGSALVLQSGSSLDGNLEGAGSNIVLVGADATIDGNAAALTLVYADGSSHEGNIRDGSIVVLPGASVTISGNVAGSILVAAGGHLLIDGNLAVTSLEVGEDAALTVTGNASCADGASVDVAASGSVEVGGRTDCVAL